ncbi:MAG: hypothetical protein R3Y28_06785 [Candidatus Gastranaerophilales bacterium]
MSIKKFDIEVEEFYPQTNGEISESIVQCWTEQALECYSLKCDCTRCSINCNKYSFKCQMAKVVTKLIDVIGTPEQKFA